MGSERNGTRCAKRWVSRRWPTTRVSGPRRCASATKPNWTAIITEWTTPRDRWEITELLQRAGVAAIPTLSNKDLAHDPHLRERGYLVELEHPRSASAR